MNLNKTINLDLDTKTWFTKSEEDILLLVIEDSYGTIVLDKTAAKTLFDFLSANKDSL